MVLMLKCMMMQLSDEYTVCSLKKLGAELQMGTTGYILGHDVDRWVFH